MKKVLRNVVVGRLLLGGTAMDDGTKDMDQLNRLKIWTRDLLGSQCNAAHSLANPKYHHAPNLSDVVWM